MRCTLALTHRHRSLVAQKVVLEGGGPDAAGTAAGGTIFGVPEGAVWGLASAIAFALHLVRSEMRQFEAKDVGQLAAAQLVVCGVLSVVVLAIQATTRPIVASEISIDVIRSVRSLTAALVCPA